MQPITGNEVVGSFFVLDFGTQYILYIPKSTSMLCADVKEQKNGAR